MHPYRMPAGDPKPLAAKEQPPLATGWLCPSCPRCHASWFHHPIIVRCILQCEHPAECTIVSSKHRHAHYHCQRCDKPFWITYSCNPNEP
jgi:hypothetical protein